MLLIVLNKVCICYAQSSLRGLEVPEARGSGVPGILTPRGRDGERKSRRIGLGGKGRDGPSTAHLVIGSEEPRNKPPANPVGKKEAFNPPPNITVYAPRSRAGRETNSWFDNIVVIGAGSGAGGAAGGLRCFCVRLKSWAL